MVSVAELLERNKASLPAFKPRLTFAEMPAAGMAMPTIAIVSCCDPRSPPEEMFGLKPGDAIVFRTAAGHVKPILKDIVVIDAFLGHGHFKQLMIVHHTDCGGLHFKEEKMKADLVARYPEKKAEIQAWETGAFGNRTLAESVLDDIEFVKKSDLLSDALKKGTRGFTFDIKTGVVSEV